MSKRFRAFAPGRVNLMGGHVDYSGGVVLPMAIDLGTTVVGTRRGDRVKLHSTDVAGTADLTLDIDDPAATEPPWARYVAGVVAELRPAIGIDGEISTTIPIGTGLSSSAALEVAVALALGADDDGGADRVALALACQRAEHRGSGMPCGIMDQLASLCGREGHALLIDCTTLAVEPVAVPGDVAVVVVDSGEQRALSEVGYGERRAEVLRAAELIGPLPQASLDDVAGIDDAVLRRRARHVVSENQRVRDVVAALRGGDVSGAGDLMIASHESLRRDQEVTTPRLDELVDRLIALPGVHGARLTGGGWGGCVVALADPGALDLGWTVLPSAGARIEFP